VERPQPEVVGWPGGIAPPGSLRSRRDSLPSPGSSHPLASHQVRTQAQWANNPGSRVVTRSHQLLKLLWVRSRRYFIPSQRLR
jgi:hypothetical protein